MNAERLNLLFDDPAPASSIRRASAARNAPLSPRDIPAGSVLGAKYEVQRRLGEGAMGIVYAARHLGLDETVAIKFVRPDIQDVDGALARFAREAKLAARIRSEHVTKVFDVGVLEPFGPFIVMEYLEGSSLAQLLEGEGPLPAARVIGYLLQACEALAAAHAIGVVHRDVKPDNLFVTRRGGAEMLQLLDFGIAQVLPDGPVLDGDPTGDSSIVFGSPLYMAPEQLRPASAVDARADIWALGVVGHELLTGDMPFAGTSVPEICATILDAEPAPLDASCPPALAAIIARCLAKDPAQRFASVAELAGALLPLATRDAHAYASRSSSILHASSALPAAALPAADAADAAEPRQPALATPPAAESPERQRRVRFQSSALVASATILALAVLGVGAGLSRTEPNARLAPAGAAVLEQHRDAPEAQPEHGAPALAQAGLPAVQASSAVASAPAEATPASGPALAAIDDGSAPGASAGSPIPMRGAVGASAPEAAPNPSQPEETARSIRATAKARSSRPAEPRAASRARARRASPGTAPRRTAPRPSATQRVRLVAPPARPRLVQRDVPVAERRSR